MLMDFFCKINLSFNNTWNYQNKTYNLFNTIGQSGEKRGKYFKLGLLFNN